MAGSANTSPKLFGVVEAKDRPMGLPWKTGNLVRFGKGGSASISIHCRGRMLAVKHEYGAESNAEGSK
jgi:hypothetical protein